MLMGYSPSESQCIADRLNCQLGAFPTSYLGIPNSASRPSMADLRTTMLNLKHSIESWQGRWFSKAARTILINSSLSSLLLSIMSFYNMRETLHHEIDTIQGGFFWASDGDKKKYHIVRWPDIWKPRDQGSLGIMSSHLMNIALLNRWLWQIANGEGGLWLRISRSKYLRVQPLAFYQRCGAPSFGSPSSKCSRPSASGPP
ncbi:ABC transporter G family member 37 [Hordeum vulgare]|nr:ABC transporter G family member 37 [Hordeum vulgare]